MPSGGVAGPRHRPGESLHVGSDGLVDGLKVLGRLRVPIVGPGEEVGRLGGAGFGLHQVVQADAEPFGQALDDLVTGVDQLAPPLADLTIGPRGRVGEHPATDAAVRLVHRRGQTRVLQSQRGSKAADARPHDRDPWGGGGSSCRHGHRHLAQPDRAGCQRSTLEQVPSGETLTHLVRGHLLDALNRHTQGIRRPVLRGQPLKRTRQNATCHYGLPCHPPTDPDQHCC